MTLLQIAFAAAVTAVLAGWCLVRAWTLATPSLSTVYRRMYGDTTTLTPASAGVTDVWWERPIAALGRMVATSSAGDRVGARRIYELRVSGATVAGIVTRAITAGVVGFIATLVAMVVPASMDLTLPVALVVPAPFAMALLTGWYQYVAITSSLTRGYRDFRAGVAAYVQLVSVCLTTRRSATEAVTYAADIGTGRAFEVIAAEAHAAPLMDRQVWEALDSVGAEYGARELEDLATSIANVSNVGVGVETTVLAVAARMRQVGLDEMQRQADRQTGAMFGPTMLFVFGVVAFLAWPLVLRVGDAFTTTT